MKSSEVSIKTRSTPASLTIQGQVTKDTTVKLSIYKIRKFHFFLINSHPNFSEFLFYHQALFARFTKRTPLTITSLKSREKHQQTNNQRILKTKNLWLKDKIHVQY